jgi:hypothetical protein
MFKKFPIILFFLLVFFNQEIVTEDSNLNADSTYLACELGKAPFGKFKPGEFPLEDLLQGKIKLELSEKIKKNIVRKVQGRKTYLNIYPRLRFVFLEIKENKTVMCREVGQFMEETTNWYSFYGVPFQKDSCNTIYSHPEYFRWVKKDWVIGSTLKGKAKNGEGRWERTLNREDLQYTEYHTRLFTNQFDPKDNGFSAESEDYQCKIFNLEEIELIKKKLEDLEEPFRKFEDAENIKFKNKNSSKRKI